MESLLGRYQGAPGVRRYATWPVAAHRGYDMPDNTDDQAAGQRDYGGGSAGERSATPSPFGQQSLEVLPGRDQERLAVHSPEAAQAQRKESAPVCGLGKERVHPDLALA